MEVRGKILVVDDEASIREFLEIMLKRERYDVSCVDSATKCLDELNSKSFDIILTDINMPEVDGLQLLAKIKTQNPNAIVVIMTAYGSAESAVQAMKNGASDYISKPFQIEELLVILEKCMATARIEHENRHLRSKLKQEYSFEKIIGNSEQMQNIFGMIRRVSKTTANVLITGESGTGKELVANAIHNYSDLKESPFVSVNCGAISENLLESEMFGHKRGAFTGAVEDHVGLFERANGGTIFLDEIESMPLQMQIRLLRVLQERVIERLGSNQLIPVDVRIIAATKVDLKEASSRKEFREDLYYRLNVVNLTLPPLRERREDIPLLFQHFVMEASKRYNYDSPTVPRSFMQDLISRNWEGNIRELKNEAERFVLGLSDQVMEPTSNNLPTSEQVNGKKVSLSHIVRIFEKTTIEQELSKHKGDIKKTYTALCIPRQTLYDKMSKYGLKRSQYT